MELHESHGLSLSMAYHNTLSSYHALRAEHETASRFAVLEATNIGATFGPSETERSFIREGEALEKHARGSAIAAELAASVGVVGGKQDASAQRQADFSGGQSYLSSARS